MDKTLHLTLKKKWFDMIASGEKKEEYREIKDYWTSRLLHPDLSLNPYWLVQFRNGYSKDAPTITLVCKGIEIKEGNPDWGAIPGEKYFVIKLGEVVETSTYKEREGE